MSVLIPNIATLLILLLVTVAIAFHVYLLYLLRQKLATTLNPEVTLADTYATYSGTLLVFVLILALLAVAAHLYSPDANFLSLWHAIAGLLAIISLALLVGIILVQAASVDQQIFRTTLSTIVVTISVAFFTIFLAVLHRTRPAVEIK